MIQFRSQISLYPNCHKG